jgi:hypothetical protein
LILWQTKVLVAIMMELKNDLYDMTEDASRKADDQSTRKFQWYYQYSQG